MTFVLLLFASVVMVALTVASCLHDRSQRVRACLDRLLPDPSNCGPECYCDDHAAGAA